MGEHLGPYTDLNKKPEDDDVGQAVWSGRQWFFYAITPGFVPLRGRFGTLLQARTAAVHHAIRVLNAELMINAALAAHDAVGLADAREQLAAFQTRSYVDEWGTGDPNRPSGYRFFDAGGQEGQECLVLTASTGRLRNRVHLDYDEAIGVAGRWDEGFGVEP